jgi:hypothetical protein
MSNCKLSRQELLALDAKDKRTIVDRICQVEYEKPDGTVAPCHCLFSKHHSETASPQGERTHYQFDSFTSLNLALY